MVKRTAARTAGALLAALLPLAAAAETRLDKAAAGLAEALFPAIPSTAAVAVFPPASPGGGVSGLAEALAGRLDAALLKKGVTVVDRRYLAFALAEQRAGASGLTDQASAASLGRLTGASLLAAGSLRPAGEKTVLAELRLIESGTGRLAAVASAEIPLDRELAALYLSTSAPPPPADRPFPGGGAEPLGRSGPGGCAWVRASASAAEEGRPWLARAEALAAARGLAALKAAGSREILALKAGDPAAWLDAAFNAAASGFTETEVLKSESREDGRFTVTLEACVRPLARGPGPAFRAGLLLNRRVFRDGDQVTAAVTAGAGALVYLYGCGPDGAAALLFPAPGENNFIEGGGTLVFPGARLEKAGTRIEARLPAGAPGSAEALAVFAVKGGTRPELSGAASCGDIASRLAASGRDWAMEMRSFIVLPAAGGGKAAVPEGK